MTYKYAYFFLEVQGPLCKDQDFAQLYWWTLHLHEWNASSFQAHTPQCPILLLSSAKLEHSQLIQAKEWQNFLSNPNKVISPRSILISKEPFEKLNILRQLRSGSQDPQKNQSGIQLGRRKESVMEKTA